jgi:hypothetical protein
MIAPHSLKDRSRCILFGTTDSADVTDATETAEQLIKGYYATTENRSEAP